MLGESSGLLTEIAKWQELAKNSATAISCSEYAKRSESSK